MRLRSQYWIPSIIFLVSFCLHLSLISKGPVTVDCLNLAINSQATLETHHLHYQFGFGYPMMVLLGSIFISIGHCVGITDPILAVNFISVLLGSIAILAFYLLVQQICDSLTAMSASFILLLNPIFLDVSTYGINHAPTLCFLFLGLLSLLRFQTAGNMPNLLLSALYFGFMGATRLQDLILTFPAIGFIFFLGLKENISQSNKYKTRSFLLFISTIILITILFHLPYFTFDHTNYNIQAKNYWKMGITENFEGFFSPHLINALIYLLNAFSAVGIICFGIGLYYTAQFSNKLLIFTVLWWIIPLNFYGNVITTAPRFFSIILPALIIPISIFLTHLLRLRKMQWSLVAMICFLIIILRPLLHTREAFIRRHHYALISDFYRWVGKSTETNATIISADDEIFITYYSRRNFLEKPTAIFKHLSPQELIDFKKKLDLILNNQKTVYITSTTMNNYDSYREFKNLMNQNYHLIDEGQMPLETWYQNPYESYPYMDTLVKVEKK